MLHPVHGVLVLEVKGGTPRRDANGNWYSGGAQQESPIQDPYAQADRSKFALRDYVRAAGNIQAANALWGHAVWFPDARAPQDCGPGSHPSITLDFTATDDLPSAIDGAFRYWGASYVREPMGAAGLAGMVSALGRPLSLRAPLAVVMRDEATEERRLTESQYNILAAIDRQRRSVISGPAGSGKTMLALEQCRRFSAAGLETLYLCFNRRLATWVAQQMRHLSGTKACTFHWLVDDLAAQAGVALPPVMERDADYFDNRAPQIPAAQAIRGTVSGPGLLPANIDLAAAELELAAQIGRERFLVEALQSVANRYDFILIDLPPSLGLLMINGLVAAGEVIMPVQCEYLAVKALTLMLTTIDKVRSKLNPTLRILGILPTMYNARTLHAQEVLDEIRSTFRVPVFAHVVKQSVRFKEAPAGGLSILDYAPDNDGAAAYRDLAQGVLS